MNTVRIYKKIVQQITGLSLNRIRSYEPRTQIQAERSEFMLMLEDVQIIGQ